MAYSDVVAYGYEGWINPWLNARRVSSADLAKKDTLWRVVPTKRVEGAMGESP